MKLILIFIMISVFLLSCKTQVQYDQGIDTVISKITPQGIYTLKNGRYTPKGYEWDVVIDSSGIYWDAGVLEIWIDGRQVYISGGTEMVRNSLKSQISQSNNKNN